MFSYRLEEVFKGAQTLFQAFEGDVLALVQVCIMCIYVAICMMCVYGYACMVEAYLYGMIYMLYGVYRRSRVYKLS